MDETKFEMIMKEVNLEEKTTAKDGDAQEQAVEEKVQTSTQITYFGKVTNVKQINEGVVKKYGADSGVKPVYKAVLTFGRSIDSDKIHCG